MILFLFAVQNDPYDVQEGQLVVSLVTKDWFEIEHRLQDFFDEEEAAAFEPVFDELDLFRAMESVYEYEGTMTLEQLKDKLNSYPNFSYSQELQDFLDSPST